MGKVYAEENVLDATFKRLNFIFDEFELVYFSVSGGKDSSVMVQLGNQVAKDRNIKFDVFYVDYEAQYAATMEHVYELKELSQIRNFYHLCLPFNSHNASSIFQPHWQPWNPDKKHLWVRDIPSDSINLSNHPFGELFIRGEEVEDFMFKFPGWLMRKHQAKKVACLVGIRSDESLNRFRSIAFGKSLYKNKIWSTEVKPNVFNFYPIYDWRTEDIWGAVAKFDLKFNKVYEMLYQSGMSIHDQRICQPYGPDQRVSLNRWAILEPETWNAVVNRVSGANFGNIYCKTSLLGHNKSEKPAHMTWQEYTVFLLESLSLYSKELVEHYIRKINIFFDYYKKNFNVKLNEIPDELSNKEIGDYEIEYDCHNWIHWKRIARCIEKNDFACHMLSYGLTKTDKDEIRELKKQWGESLGIQTNRKDLRIFKKELENEN